MVDVGCRVPVITKVRCTLEAGMHAAGPVTSHYVRAVFMLPRNFVFHSLPCSPDWHLQPSSASKPITHDGVLFLMARGSRGGLSGWLQLGLGSIGGVMYICRACTSRHEVLS